MGALSRLGSQLLSLGGNDIIHPKYHCCRLRCRLDGLGLDLEGLHNSCRYHIRGLAGGHIQAECLALAGLGPQSGQ